MRVLFTTNPQSGHWHPLVPFAEALRAAGHQVAFATTPTACTAIRALGFHCVPAGADETADEGQARREWMAALPGREASAWVWPNRFAGTWTADRLPDLVAVCQDWEPAIVVREYMEFAGCIAAEFHGLPHAAVQVTAWRPQFHRLIVPPLNHLRQTLGLPPDSNLAMLHRYLLIVPAPPSYLNSASPLPATAHAVRHVPFDRSGAEPLPAWVDLLPDRPVVYATMGTAFNRVEGILGVIVEALRDEPVTLVVTTGRDQDPGDFGAQPPNVHLERYVPQSLFFPYCDMVLTHGGSGTVMTGLGHGLPMAIVPVSADQPENALRCEQIGVARVVPPHKRTPDAVRKAVRDVLQNPRYRSTAERLRDEMARLPGPAQVVGWLERLATEQRPLLSSPLTV